MKSLRFLDRRVGSIVASLGLLLGVVAPAALPMFASAAQVTTRSIAMTTSAEGATAEYTVTFTPVTGAASGAVDLFFCNDSPIPGQTCTAPSGFSLSSATLGALSTGGASIVSQGANKIEVSVDTTASPVVLVLDGVVNPNYVTTTAANEGFYGRIQTYGSTTDATAAYADATDVGSVVDDGGIAMAITSGIGVTATVRETMTFCVAGNGGTVASLGAGAGPSGACGADNADGETGATGLDTTDVPLVLGHGEPAALDSSAADTGSDWAQISTNAASGAVVSLKNTNGGNCNGLFRAGDTGSTCDIAGVGSTPIALSALKGNAYFGLALTNIGDAPNSVAVPTGTITPTAGYAGGNYGMGNGTTTTYGDPIFNTDGPIANKNVKLTFAASAAPTTPAGVYRATMNLIATGTF